MEHAYYPTHIRFSPWLIGVIGGYVLFEGRKRSIRIPKVTHFNVNLSLLSSDFSYSNVVHFLL